MNTLLTESTLGQTTTPRLTRRIQALDGWRGIAILLVLFDHIQIALFHSYTRPWMQTGKHGVTIFFVLSGFLITSKLLAGPIDLKQFYLRRFFRLMPAAWTYLAVLLLLNRLTGESFTSLPEVTSCLFFYRNMVDVPGHGIAGHFWSLSLEEQFYLVWPCLLLLIGSKRCLWIAIVGACACAIYRWVFWAHYDRLGAAGMTQVRADALLIGCAAALILSAPHLTDMVRWSSLAAIPAIGILCDCIRDLHRLTTLRESIAIAILISFATLRPDSSLAKLLSWRPLAWLGVVSYSIYIWQELFVHLGTGKNDKLLYIFVGLPIFALGSYYLIERPSIRARDSLFGPRP